MSSIVRRASSKLLRLLQRAADPGAVASQVQLYTKSLDGVSQGYAQVPDGRVYQITPPFFSQYAVVANAAVQTLRIVVANHLEYDFLANAGGMPASLVTLSTGVGQANGVITITGRRFWIYTFIATNCNEGNIFLNWTTTAGVAIPQEWGGTLFSPSRASDPVASDSCPLQTGLSGIVDATGGPVTLESRFSSVSNAIDIAGVVFFVPLG